MEANMTHAFCPICGSELIEDDGYGLSVDVSECCEYVVGHCEKCEKEYQWKNIFVFSHVEDIEKC